MADETVNLRGANERIAVYDLVIGRRIPALSCLRPITVKDCGVVFHLLSRQDFAEWQVSVFSEEFVIFLFHIVPALEDSNVKSD